MKIALVAPSPIRQRILKVVNLLTSTCILTRCTLSDPTEDTESFETGQ